MLYCWGYHWFMNMGLIKISGHTFHQRWLFFQRISHSSLDFFLTNEQLFIYKCSQPQVTEYSTENDLNYYFPTIGLQVSILRIGWVVQQCHQRPQLFLSFLCPAIPTSWWPSWSQEDCCSTRHHILTWQHPICARRKRVGAKGFLLIMFSAFYQEGKSFPKSHTHSPLLARTRLHVFS